MTWEGTPLDPPRPTEVLQVGGSARFKRAGHPSRFLGFRIRLEPSILLERPVKFDPSDRTFYRPDFTGPAPTRCRPHGSPGAPARRQTRRTRCGFPIGVIRGSPGPGRHRAGEPRLIPRIRANEQTDKPTASPPEKRPWWKRQVATPATRGATTGWDTMATTAAGSAGHARGGPTGGGTALYSPPGLAASSIPHLPDQLHAGRWPGHARC